MPNKDKTGRAFLIGLSNMDYSAAFAKKSNLSVNLIKSWRKEFNKTLAVHKPC